MLNSVERERYVRTEKPVDIKVIGDHSERCLMG